MDTTRFRIRLAAAFLRCAVVLGVGILAPAHGATASERDGGATVSAEGQLQVFVEDHRKHAVTRHYLKTKQGRTKLKFKRKAPSLLSGTRVRVDGELVGNTLEVTSVEAISAETGPVTLGGQKTVVLLVNFQDRPDERPWTVAAARSVVFGSVSDYFRENSADRTWLDGDVFGWYTIPVSSSTCSTVDIAAKAEQAATGAGVDLAAYARKLYVFPNTSACGFGGMASVGGTPSQAWINGYLDLNTVAHEMGHNFGLNHAHALDCGATTNDAPCSSSEYGDTLDVMGGSQMGASAGHYAAFAKERLGWLGGASSPVITEASATGTYSLSRYEDGSAGTKALKILKSTDPTTGQKTWYYLEYRQAVGFDSFLATRSGQYGRGDVTNGVVVRTAVESNGNSSHLLNMNPVVDPFTGRVDWLNPALKVGGQFVDAEAGVSISPVWADGTTIGLDVQFGATTHCVPADPVVSVGEHASAVSAGTSVSYVVQVTNADDLSCGTTRFGLAGSVPNGWSGDLAATTLSLAPGATGSTTLTVTSPTNAESGSYGVGVTATNNGAVSFSGSDSAAYSVAASDLRATVATSKPVYARGTSATMNATVKVGSIPVSGATVVFTVVKPNGAKVTYRATTKSAGEAVYTLRLSKQKDPAGTYSVMAEATSGGQAATASTSFVVQ